MKDKALKLTIHLDGTTPSVKREVVIKKDQSLHTLHKLIQSAMPWSNSHLHLFELGEQIITYPGFIDEDHISSLDVLIEDIFKDKGDEITYSYDFGDNWTHSITFNGYVPITKHFSYPFVLSGKNACPPEDCGGPDGFHQLKKSIKRLKTEEDKSTLEWANQNSNTVSPYDPSDYDPFTHSKPLFLFDHERIE